MKKNTKYCCEDNQLFLYKKCKNKKAIIKSYKVLKKDKKYIVKIHNINKKNHFVYYYVYCKNINECKCYILDIQNQSLYPKYSKKLQKAINELKKEKNNSEIKGT